MSGYNYAAPGWYRPWVFVGSARIYRPYPYHDWYFSNHHAHGYGVEDRGGYRGHERGERCRGY